MRDMAERHWVTLGVFILTAVLLSMAYDDPKLWDVEVYKVIIQAVVLTGLLNMVLAFHFTSNKGSEVARENTGKLADAFKAAATAGGGAPLEDPNAIHEGDDVTLNKAPTGDET